MKKHDCRVCGIPFTVHYKVHSKKQIEIVKMVHNGLDFYELIDPYNLIVLVEYLKKL